MGLGTAIGVGAATGLAGSLISSNASQSAAQTQANAANQASANQLAEFNQTRQSLAPFTGAGTNALGTLESSLGLSGGNGQNLLAANGINGLTFNHGQGFSPVGGAIFNPTMQQLEQTPGYQFNLNQGLQGVANSNAAAGRGISGAALAGSAGYATGLANNTLQTQDQIFQNNLANQQNVFSTNANQFQTNLGNVLNPLSNLVNAGQNSAATTGQQGIQAVGNANQALIGGANAQAAGTVGSANAISSGLNSAAGAPLNYALYNQLLGSGGMSSQTANTMNAFPLLTGGSY